MGMTTFGESAPAELLFEEFATVDDRQKRKRQPITKRSLRRPVFILDTFILPLTRFYFVIFITILILCYYCIW